MRLMIITDFVSHILRFLRTTIHCVSGWTESLSFDLDTVAWIGKDQWSLWHGHVNKYFDISGITHAITPLLVIIDWLSLMVWTPKPMNKITNKRMNEWWHLYVHVYGCICVCIRYGNGYFICINGANIQKNIYISSELYIDIILRTF